MDDEDYRTESEVEPDSDHEEDTDHDELGQWLGQLETLKMDLDSDGTGTVRRRSKTVVTPKMAMESFRFSFLNSDESQDVNFDAILGELCELETQLSTTQSELAQQSYYCSQGFSTGLAKDEHRDSGNDLAQAELDALASEITQSLGYTSNRHSLPGDHDFDHRPYLTKHGSYNDITNDIGETDSAFSENASLPSSESYTSMVTVSSSADVSSQMDVHNMTSNVNNLTPLSVQACEMHALITSHLSLYEEELEKENFPPEEQRARLKAEKIRIALEKIKEAKIRKLFVRAFARDGSSKSILVDEKMLIGQVCNILADKNHMRLNSKLAVVEHMPELMMERIIEDHDSLVENMVMWTRDTKNRILFEERDIKYDLFRHPEKYLLVSTSSEKGASLDPARRQKLIQDFFGSGANKVPEVEGVMYLKSEGKKAWKRYYFVLRSSGLYYNPKGKVSKASKDLTCMVNFDFVDVYLSMGWKKKYHAPTDYCFALKHPQIQKKTSKYIRYFCTENKNALDHWITGIRIAKYGRQLLTNYEKLQREIHTWDYREMKSSVSEVESFDDSIELNPEGNLKDSRLSMPEPGSRHSIVHVKNSSLVRNSAGSDTTIVENADDIVCLEISAHHKRNSSLSGQQSIDMSMGGLQRTHTKRVSFSNTHSVINAESGEELVPVRHRDSITSASTDSSEDSTSSGESRHSVTSSSSRGKFRAKIPVTTETTRQISEMYQVAMEGSSISSCESDTRSMGHERKSSLSSPVHSQGGTDRDRRKSAPIISGRESRHERKGSDSSMGREQKVLSQSLTQGQMATSPTPNVYPQPSHTSNVSPSPPPLKCPLNQKVYHQQTEQSIVKSVQESHYTVTNTLQSQQSKVKMTMSPPPQRIKSPPPPPPQRMMSPPPPQRVLSPPPGTQAGHSQIPRPSSAQQLHQIQQSTYKVSQPSPQMPAPRAPPPPIPLDNKGQKASQIQSMASMPPPPPSSAVTQAASQQQVPVSEISPPPPMPPPGHVTKPPSPGILPLPQGPFPVGNSPSQLVPAKVSIAPVPPPKQTPQSVSVSPSQSESSPSTPKGMIPMPPAMPLLQNQYVGSQAAAIGHIRRSSRSGSEASTGSPSKSPIPVAPPAPPAVSPNPHVNQMTSSQSKIPKGIPPPIPAVGQNVGGLTSPVFSPSPSSPTVPSPLYSSGHHMSTSQTGSMYDYHDNVRVRPGPQAKSSVGQGNVPHNSQPPPPPPLGPPVSRPDGKGHVRISSGGGNTNYAHQSHTPSSPSALDDQCSPQQHLPFLAELSKRPHVNRGSNGKIPPQTLPKPLDGGHKQTAQMINGASAHNTIQSVTSPNGPVQLRASSSAGKPAESVKKGIPPPPPRRSQTTRLSTELSKASNELSSVPNMNDTIYESFNECDGIMDINDLPPPPPELLAGLASEPNVKRGKPPPPPPKRSKETHLSSQ